MGRFNAGELDNYSSGGGGSSYFSLTQDGDVASVRFMYNSADDIVGHAVHEVTLGGKKRYVNCIRSYNEPKANCPLCAANNFQRPKLYVPLYVISINGEEINEVRGKTFFQKMAAICARYSNGKTPLVAHTFDIERHGKPGDTGTSYDVFETGDDDTRLEDLPEIPDVIGRMVLDKSFDDMEYYLDNGEFPDAESGTSDYRSGGTRSEGRPVGRRTPSSTNSGRGGRKDAF